MIAINITIDLQFQHLRETLSTLGNGYFATRRAAVEMVANDILYSGTYLAGGYNRLKTEIAGRVVENEDLVNIPNGHLVTFRPQDGDWFNIIQVTILDYHHELDLKRGILRRKIHFNNRPGRQTMEQTRRFIHMAEKREVSQQHPMTWSI